jgi:TRAP transporter TAXI family solute receptor
MPPPLLSNSRRIAFALVLLATAVVYYVRWQENTAVQLVMGAGSSDGDGYRTALAIAEVVQRHHPRIQIVVVETQGSQENADLLGSGRLDLALIQADIRTSPTARLIAPLFADAFQLLSHGESDVNSPGNLRGKTVAIPPIGSGGNASFWEVATHYGLSESDLTALPMSPEAAVWALGSGAVDAAFHSRPPGSSLVRDAVLRSGASLVPIEQAAAIRLGQPDIEPGVVPRGSYRGDPPVPPIDLPTAVVQVLFTGDTGLDGSVVYDLTSVLFERRRELMDLAPLAGFITTPDRTAGTFMPIHEGAQRYYSREQPNFLQENAELIALLLSIVALSVSSLLRMADQGRRRRLESYNGEILGLYSAVKDSDDPRAVAAQKDEMLQVLVRVLDDAEEGLVTEEGFQVFSLTWQAVYQALRDRLTMHRDPAGNGDELSGPSLDSEDVSP